MSCCWQTIQIRPSQHSRFYAVLFFTSLGVCDNIFSHIRAGSLFSSVSYFNLVYLLISFHQIPMVTFGGVGWSVVCFFFLNFFSFFPPSHANVDRCEFFGKHTHPKLPHHHKRHTPPLNMSITTIAAVIIYAAAKLSPPPEIRRLNISAAYPSPPPQLHLCHSRYIAVVTPMSSPLRLSHCNRRAATAILPPLPLLQYLPTPTNYHHPHKSAA